jgi:hypothetical protein
VATAGDGRFRLLESLRLYAADALAGLPDAAECTGAIWNTC